jgi:hypothetical protein
MAVTEAGTLVGTPAYMAPEQTRNDPVDQRADLFSLGAVLYEAATGNRPFRGGDLMAAIASLALDRPAAPHEVQPQIPQALSRLILRLLEKDPAQRPASAREVLDELDAIERALAKPAYDGVQPMRSRGGWLAAAALLLIVGGLAWMWGATVVRFVNNKGQLIVEVNDPHVDVRIVQNGVVVRDWTTQREFTLEVGDGRVEVAESSGLEFSAREFSLKRGGTTTVTVAYKPPPTSPGATDPTDTAQQVARIVLDEGGRIALRGAETELIGPDDPLPSTAPGLYWIWLENPSREGLDKFLEASRGLARSPQLLHLGSDSLVDDDIKDLVESAGFKQLGDLSLRGNNLSIDCVEHLAALQGLKFLAIQGPRITDEWLAGIQRISSLVGIGVPNSEVTDAGLMHLRDMRLEVINLYGCRITARGLDNLGGMPTLRDLNVYGAEIGDEDVERLRNFPRLEMLWLGATRVTDEGIAKLASMRTLRSLHLGDLPITDTGLAHLESLPLLDDVDVHNTRVTRVGLESLRAARPNCRILSDFEEF